jgi:hypothetical protein
LKLKKKKKNSPQFFFVIFFKNSITIYCTVVAVHGKSHTHTSAQKLSSKRHNLTLFFPFLKYIFMKS